MWTTSATRRSQNNNTAILLPSVCGLNWIVKVDKLVKRVVLWRKKKICGRKVCSRSKVKSFENWKVLTGSAKKMYQRQIYLIGIFFLLNGEFIIFFATHSTFSTIFFMLHRLKGRNKTCIGKTRFESRGFIYHSIHFFLQFVWFIL